MVATILFLWFFLQIWFRQGYDAKKVFNLIKVLKAFSCFAQVRRLETHTRLVYQYITSKSRTNLCSMACPSLSTSQKVVLFRIHYVFHGNFKYCSRRLCKIQLVRHIWSKLHTSLVSCKDHGQWRTTYKAVERNNASICFCKANKSFLGICDFPQCLPFFDHRHGKPLFFLFDPHTSSTYVTVY